MTSLSRSAQIIPLILRYTLRWASCLSTTGTFQSHT